MSSNKYHRAGKVAVPLVLEQINNFKDKPHRYKVVFNGYRVNINSIRLKTFLTGTTCPCCNIEASFFAIEKTLRKIDLHNDSQGKKGFHLNLYGLNEKGEEVLFTHDHTLARGLGGADSLENTVTMCYSCNSHKGQLECRIKNTKSEKFKILLTEEINTFLETGIKTTPVHPEPHLDLKPDSLVYKKKLEKKQLRKMYKKMNNTTLLNNEDVKITSVENDTVDNHTPNNTKNSAFNNNNHTKEPYESRESRRTFKT